MPRTEFGEETHTGRVTPNAPSGLFGRIHTAAERADIMQSRLENVLSRVRGSTAVSPGGESRKAPELNATEDVIRLENALERISNAIDELEREL